jgi:hypothetical protein
MSRIRWELFAVAALAARSNRDPGMNVAEPIGHVDVVDNTSPGVLLCDLRVDSSLAASSCTAQVYYSASDTAPLAIEVI